MNCQTHEDGDTISYTYDSTGRLATVVDSATGRTTTYTYDFADRTAKYTETGANYSHSVEYGYDETGKLLSQTEIINGTTHSTAYTYDLDNRITAKTTDGITVEYTYDGLGRVTQQVTKNGETVIKTETYTFNENSSQVATYRTQIGSYDVTYSYTYDDNGNILTVYDDTNTTSYEYDSQNQLIRENNQASGFTRTWTYDNAGNILSRNQYSHTADELGTVKSTVSYTYGDEDWGDLLTAYNGAAISYDNIGNPTAYRGMQFTWEHGRQLASAQYGSVTEIYTYDTDGMRIGRTSGSNTYKYVYNGSQLVRMEYNDHVLEFTYDAQGTPATVTYNGAVYYYITNLQGDVVRLVNETGVVQAQYLYDAWGTCATFASKPIGQLNPLRYRGYVYDQETGLYYLQSRYYDPTVGRFINADTFTSTGQGFTGGNMFAYCGNNSVMNADYTGEFWGLVLAGVAIMGTLLAIPSSENQEPYYRRAASEKYNSSTVHVYYEGIGEPAEGKFNVRFYSTGENNKYVNINIEESLKVSSTYEMDAILDVVSQSEYYSREMFGSKDYMKAQWIAHNISYRIASNSSLGFKIMSYLGDSSNPIESSSTLDIRCKKNIGKKGKIVYKFLEYVAQ